MSFQWWETIEVDNGWIYNSRAHSPYPFSQNKTWQKANEKKANFRNSHMKQYSLDTLLRNTPSGYTFTIPCTFSPSNILVSINTSERRAWFLIVGIFMCHLHLDKMSRQKPYLESWALQGWPWRVNAVGPGMGEISSRIKSTDLASPLCTSSTLRS